MSVGPYARGDGAFEMNDWSFGQLFRLAGVAEETVNRLAGGYEQRIVHSWPNDGLATTGWPARLTYDSLVKCDLQPSCLTDELAI